jgi:hypothetical protein
MFTCSSLRHTLLEWQKNKSVHPKASKSKLKADRPDRSNYFNCKNDGGTIISCWAVKGRKLFTSPDIADTDTFLMNTWNTLPESYQQRVYNNTHATVEHQIQQGENPPPAVVFTVEAACVDNTMLLDYLTSDVMLEEPEIRSTDPNLPIGNNCTDDKLHCGMPAGSRQFEDEGGECDADPTAGRRRRATTELERFDLGTSDVDGYEGEDSDDAAADEEEEASQADHGSTQIVEHLRHSSRECEDWTVYFRCVKCDNGEANASASDVSEAKTALQ